MAIVSFSLCKTLFYSLFFSYSLALAKRFLFGCGSMACLCDRVIIVFLCSYVWDRNFLFGCMSHSYVSLLLCLYNSCVFLLYYYDHHIHTLESACVISMYIIRLIGLCLRSPFTILVKALDISHWIKRKFLCKLK